MNTPVRLWVLVALLAVAHFGLHVGLGIGPAAPELLTIALLLAAREVGMGWGAGLGFFFGLLEDALSVLSFGANTVAMTVVGLVGAVTRDLFVGDSLLFLVSYFAVGTWSAGLIRWLMVSEEVRRPFVDTVVVQGGIGAIYAAAVGVGLMAAFGLWREEPA